MFAKIFIKYFLVSGRLQMKPSSGEVIYAPPSYVLLVKYLLISEINTDDWASDTTVYWALGRTFAKDFTILIAFCKEKLFLNIS